MKKRIISLLLVCCMVLSLIPAMAFAAVDTQGASAELANPFADVKETDWCYDAVQYARINGFFNGTSKTTFGPNGTMTRGMFVTVLGRHGRCKYGRLHGSDPIHRRTAVQVLRAVCPVGGIAWDHERHRRGKVSPPDTRINRRQMAANCGDVFGGGTVSYDPGTHTLTLTNYTYSGEGAICGDSMYACIVYKRILWTSEPLEPLTLKLVGSNALTYS